MLSLETDGNEMNWSLGRYMTNAEVEKAFGVSDLPKPWSVAPNQPFTGSFYYTWGLVPLLLLFVVAVFMIPLSGFTNTVLSEQISLPPMTNPQTAQVAFSQPFEIRANRNVRITASAPVSNSWADLDVDLVNDQSQEVESVNVPIEYYQGVEDGKAGPRAGSSRTRRFRHCRRESIRFVWKAHGKTRQQPMPVSVKVDQNVNRGVNFCVCFHSSADTSGSEPIQKMGI